MTWVLRLLWRRRWLAAPLLAIAVAAMVATYRVTPSTFRVTGSVVLLNPPVPPRDAPPDAGNPFLRFRDSSVVVDIVARIMKTEPVARDLRSRGATGRYTVAANIAYYNGPIIDVAAEGEQASVARRTAEVVMDEIGQQLEMLQAGRGTSPDYFIKAATVVAPTHPRVVSSDRLRKVIAVGGAAAAVVIGLIAAADSLIRRRARRRRGRVQGNRSDRATAVDRLGQEPRPTAGVHRDAAPSSTALSGRSADGGG